MKHKTLYKFITLLIPTAVLILYLLREYLISAAFHLPRCLFYSIYHRYCPSCGNTRSVTALLHGDILTSLRFNVVPVILLVLIVLGYIEFATFSFGKRVQLLPRKLWIYLVLIAILCVYWIVRNFIPYLTP